MDKATVMGGEKSYEGIVVKKLAGKAAMASESTQESSMQTRPKRREFDAKPGTVEEKQRT